MDVCIRFVGVYNVAYTMLVEYDPTTDLHTNMLQSSV